MARSIAESSLSTPSDTYLYSLAQNGSTFATIGSDDTLRLFDPSLKLLHKAPSAHTGISCLTTFSNGFATAGRDSFIRTWDARAQRAGNQLLAAVNGAGISALACHDHLIAAGTESAKEGLGDVSVMLFDTRNPGAPVRSYVESHTDSITQLAFHPTQPNVLLSGSTDGLISLFDVNIEEEEDALQQVLNPRSAVHCAGFLSGTEVYVVTTDEHFSVHSLSENVAEDSKSALDLGDVRERLGCMYVVDLIPGPQPVLVCGHNNDEKLSIVQLQAQNGWGFGTAIDLVGAHGDDVVRDVIVLSEDMKAVSCGEDGRVKVWDLRSAAPRT
ncbi:uncharacterized protein LTR77_004143 [Saxophila tyrrhenica]|uniref:WD40 repeat-like protein n=1 Tax=Saxophila tyrrhenica TaxID=1690608 RepID=A0AAV9PC55_9PEZI|nr:hypothetical protein LTR77_004143 [Saxophila tyrrhenica]